MERKYESQEQAVNVAKEAMWLAYQASRPMGLGVLHEKGGEPREAVIEATFPANSDSGHADYVFGRMMKTYFNVTHGIITCGDNVRGDYQSWAGKYPTSAALIDAAERSLQQSA